MEPTVLYHSLCNIKSCVSVWTLTAAHTCRDVAKTKRLLPHGLNISEVQEQLRLPLWLLTDLQP